MVATKYSICATHYNNAEYIKESAGVLAEMIEDRPEWELVITDAGSDDGSLEYLRDLADQQDNVRVVVEKGINIGEGRQLATKIAGGDILVQPMDLDAAYYQDDRIIDITHFYEDIIENEGEVLLSAGIAFCTANLCKELGGWREFATNEETELKRRALRQDKLRFCPIRVFDQHSGSDKGLISEIKRFYNNSTAKFQTGVRFWHMLLFWLRNTEGLKPKFGAVLVFPFSWLAAKRSGTSFTDSYDKYDEYLIDFKKTVYQKNPELWLDPPESLAEYVNEAEIEHIQSRE
ncbi:MAG: glycosyltransferase family 2 protein [Halobacteriaceae archaeon]